MSGEVVGNDSVHWRMTHEDRKTLKPRKTRLTRGKFGGGHEVEFIDGAAEALGRDGIPFDHIGVGKGHDGYFRVTLRFHSDKRTDLAALKQALIAQVNKMKTVGVMHELVVDVPAVHRTKDQVSPAVPPAEVHIDW